MGITAVAPLVGLPHIGDHRFRTVALGLESGTQRILGLYQQCFRARLIDRSAPAKMSPISNLALSALQGRTADAKGVGWDRARDIGILRQMPLEMISGPWLHRNCDRHCQQRMGVGHNGGSKQCAAPR